MDTSEFPTTVIEVLTCVSVEDDQRDYYCMSKEALLLVKMDSSDGFPISVLEFPTGCCHIISL